MATSAGPSFETRPAGAPQDEVQRIAHRAAQGDFRWDAVEMRPYKEDERALYKAGGNPTGPTGIAEHASDSLLKSGADGHWRVEPLTGKAPDPREK